jgi:AraC-like DNA-binding protein
LSGCLLVHFEKVVIFFDMRVNLRLEQHLDGLLYLFDASCNPPTMRSHSHDELEMNLLVEGTLVYVINGKKVQLSPGMMLWLFPSMEHQVVVRSSNCKMYVAAFKQKLVSLVAKEENYEILQRDLAEASVRKLSPQNTLFLQSLMKTILAGHVNHDDLNAGLGYGQDKEIRYSHNDPVLLNSGLHFLIPMAWQLYQSAVQEKNTRSLHPSIAKAIELLRDHDEKMSLVELAKKCGSSPAHFSQLFHKQLGVPLNHYRNSLRIERFISIFGDGRNVTATEALYQAGFGSYAQFYKVFRKTFGYGPRKYFRDLKIS